MAILGERTYEIFALLDIPPATKAASGRYLRSATLFPGIRYWAGHGRQKDFFGVQFFGEGLEDAAQYRQALANAGFASRTPQPSQLTFCREIDFLTDGGADVTAIKQAKVALDEIIR
ncbi:hypothetical protein ABC365_04295 [Brevundimonas sp. 3P9-tot-E]|uniref:hypothetical protein n=1 Tax=unclassified Brevundimonas TaxID=2622653 RepID=UPI0039A05800